MFLKYFLFLPENVDAAGRCFSFISAKFVIAVGFHAFKSKFGGVSFDGFKRMKFYPLKIVMILAFVVETDVFHNKMIFNFF